MNNHRVFNHGNVESIQCAPAPNQFTEVIIERVANLDSKMK